MTFMRRPTMLIAVACAAAGLLILLFGPAIRAAVGAGQQPAVASTPAGLLDMEAESELEAPPPEPLATATEPARAIVYISGAVAYPDVYRLPADARVKDLVVAAGGFSPDAAPEAINLAAPLKDAQHIHVPRFDDAAAAPVAPAGESDAGDSVAGGLLDLNTANQADLEDLPGIGATIAERILAYREEHGGFNAVEELREVSGIGDKLFERIAPLVTVGTP